MAFPFSEHVNHVDGYDQTFIVINEIQLFCQYGRRKEASPASLHPPKFSATEDARSGPAMENGSATWRGLLHGSGHIVIDYIRFSLLAKIVTSLQRKYIVQALKPNPAARKHDDKGIWSKEDLKLLATLGQSGDWSIRWRSNRAVSMASASGMGVQVSVASHTKTWNPIMAIPMSAGKKPMKIRTPMINSMSALRGIRTILKMSRII